MNDNTTQPINYSEIKNAEDYFNQQPIQVPEGHFAIIDHNKYKYTNGEWVQVEWDNDDE
jgi:hypothetical protein